MLEALLNSVVADIERAEALIVDSDDSIESVIRRMYQANRGRVLVCDRTGDLVGVFTQHDVATRLSIHNTDWAGMPVSTVMTHNPRCVYEHTPLSEILLLMTTGGFRSVPVVTMIESPTGLISARDVLQYIADTFPEEFLNLPPVPARFADKPWGA